MQKTFQEQLASIKKAYKGEPLTPDDLISINDAYSTIALLQMCNGQQAVNIFITTYGEAHKVTLPRKRIFIVNNKGNFSKRRKVAQLHAFDLTMKVKTASEFHAFKAFREKYGDKYNEELQIHQTYQL